ETHHHAAVGEAGVSVASSDGSRQPGSDRSIDVGYGKRQLDRGPGVDRVLCFLGESLGQPRDGWAAEPGMLQVAFGPNQEVGEAGGHRMVDRLQQVGSPDDLAEGASAERRQMASDLLGQHPKERHDLLSGTRELRPQVLLLSCDFNLAPLVLVLVGDLSRLSHERKYPVSDPDCLWLGYDYDEPAGSQATIRFNLFVRAETVCDDFVTCHVDSDLPCRAAVY